MPIKVKSWVSDLAERMAASDLILTMGGYNSMLETVSIGRPAINIPRTGPSQEQRIRARLFHDRGLMEYADLDEVTPGQLAGLIRETLTAAPHEAELPVNGAEVAARRIARGCGWSVVEKAATHVEIRPHRATEEVRYVTS